MPSIIYDQHQMGTDTARGERAWGLCRLAPEADHPQDWRAVCRKSRPCSSRLVNTGGGVTTSRLLRLFPFTNARRPALGRLRSRFSGFAFPAVQGNRVNSVCCALIGRSHQLYRISDKPGSDLAYPFHSSTSSLSHDNRDNEARTQNAGIPFQGS